MIIITTSTTYNYYYNYYYNYLFFNHNNIYSIKNSTPQEPNDKGDALVSKVSHGPVY